MTEAGLQTDKSLGLGLVFGIVAVLGALVMYIAAADQLTAGWGFALAMIAASIAVAVIHIFS